MGKVDDKLLALRYDPLIRTDWSMARTARSSWLTPGARKHTVIVYQLSATARWIIAVMVSSPPMLAQVPGVLVVIIAGRPPTVEFDFVTPDFPGKPFAVQVTRRPPAGSCRIGLPQDTLMLVDVVVRMQGLCSWLGLRYVISAEKLDTSLHERACHVAGYRNDRPRPVNRARLTVAVRGVADPCCADAQPAKLAVTSAKIMITRASRKVPVMLVRRTAAGRGSWDR